MMWLLGALGLTGGGIGIAALLGGWPWMLALATSAGKVLWRFLKHASFWQLAFGAVLLFATIEHFHLAGERRHSAKSDAQLAKIAEAGKHQKQISERTVEKVVKGDPNVRVIVKTIHDAPLPEGCRTPGLETLRDAL